MSEPKAAATTTSDLVAEAQKAARMSAPQFAKAYRFDPAALAALADGAPMDSAIKAYLTLIKSYPQFVRDKLVRLDKG